MNKTVSGNPGAPKIEFDCDRCGAHVDQPPNIHPWTDRHSATPDEMCKPCFGAFLEQS